MQTGPADDCIEAADQLCGSYIIESDRAWEKSHKCNTPRLTSQPAHGQYKHLLKTQIYKSCHPLHLHVVDRLSM
jgi:hypothetical protein